ncbi:MAG TPA: response regulator [Elusimicrobiales bacterium]|nr:response regulator [Elusimicrobiales bacterium]
MSQKTTVLIADDDQDLLEQMKLYLESRGYNTITASTQKEAEALLKPGAFQAAVLDLMMENPDSGFVLSHKIKKLSSNIPVIIVTSVTRETGCYFDKAQDSNAWIKADLIIHKELRFEQVHEALDRLLKAGGKPNA